MLLLGNRSYPPTNVKFIHFIHAEIFIEYLSLVLGYEDALVNKRTNQ